MLLAALGGALIGGCYGALHDQVTYSISPEYFTTVKARQFAWADFGWSRRVFASVVGFLAAGAAGLFAAWFMARIAVPRMSLPEARGLILRGLGILFGFAAAGGILGWQLVLRHTGDYSYWRPRLPFLPIQDLPHFVAVAYIHNGGYLGGLAGLIIALIYVKLKSAR